MLWIHVCDVELPLAASLCSFFSVSFYFFVNVKALFFCFFSTKCANNSKFGVVILDLIGYNNLIRHSKDVDILYKLLRLLEDREQIITDRNTKKQTTKLLIQQINHWLQCGLQWIYLLTQLPSRRTVVSRERAAPRLWVMPRSGGKTRSGFAESVDL